VLVGGWGRRALERLDAAAAPGTTFERSGASLGIAGVEGVDEGRWRRWRSGPPSGAFVLVEHDRERDLALVARDPLGGRPLVYARLGNGVLLAEHEHQILDLLPAAPGPDRLALEHWVERGGIPPGRTLYEGISRLPPGHRLVLSREGVADERYWAPRYEGTMSGSREEIAERLRIEAFAAVDRAAGSDRVAVRLSGGLDSACVAAGLAARGAGVGEARALAAVFPGQVETDESELIEATARQTGLELDRVRFEGPAQVLVPALSHIERWRLPPSSPNLFVWEPVAARARELGVTAMLDGEGGDELFGLAPYLIADALRGGRLGQAWSLTARIPGVGESPDPRVRLRALRVFGIGGLAPARARRWRRRRAARRTESSLLTERGLLGLAEFDDRAAERQLDGPLWWRSLAADLGGGGEAFDVAGHMRRSAVDAGVDGCHPFLFDRDLVETVLSTPPRLQFDPVRDRALLRDALRGRIPEQVRTRYAKSHFTPLLVGALAGADGERLAGALAAPRAPIRDFLRPGALEPLLAGRGEGMPAALALRVWRVGIANEWLKALQ
jgi:asparagine synthase (glutamine-hydrolysing)